MSQLTCSRAIHFHFGTRVVTFVASVTAVANVYVGDNAKKDGLSHFLDTKRRLFPVCRKTKWRYDDALGYALCIFGPAGREREPLTENRFPASWTPCNHSFLQRGILYTVMYNANRPIFPLFPRKSSFEHHAVEDLYPGPVIFRMDLSGVRDVSKSREEWFFHTLEIENLEFFDSYFGVPCVYRVVNRNYCKSRKEGKDITERKDFLQKFRI